MPMHTRRRALTFLVLCVWMLVAALGQAQPSDATLHSREATDFFHNLMSPYCPGLLLADCRSEGGRQLRAEISTRLAAGETRDAIETDLVVRYGPSIRTVPGLEGIGLVAWVGPAILGIVGLGLALFAIRRLTGSAVAGVAVGSDREAVTTDRALDERLQDELAALD